MTTVREQFNRSFPGASSRQPLVTACNRASDVKKVADHLANIWREQPRWWIFSTPVAYGDLHKFDPGNVIWIQHDSPGLVNGRYLLILGASGGSRPGTPVRIRAWG